MTSELYRLVYYSVVIIDGDEAVVDGAINLILAASRANNPRVGVTGALMFNSGCFGQILEGPLAHVEETFERIQQDERHSEVTLLAFDQVPERAFPSWSMGHVGKSLRDADRFGLIGLDTGFDLASMTGSALFETLVQLAMEEERVNA